MGAADHEDEETWEPLPPNITAVVHQRRDPQGDPVTSTPDRQGHSPTSPRSPVLGYGLTVRTSSLFRMSDTPTSVTTYSYTGSTLTVPSAAPTKVSHTAAAPDAGDVMTSWRLSGHGFLAHRQNRAGFLPYPGLVSLQRHSLPLQ
jgi:hypothetical protein